MWFGRLGVLLGPVLGYLHLVTSSFMPPPGQGLLGQYDAVQLAGYLLAAPEAQYFILFGFAICLLWIVLWAVRMGLALRSWIFRRRTAG